jgi:hypothetical protein
MTHQAKSDGVTMRFEERDLTALALNLAKCTICHRYDAMTAAIIGRGNRSAVPSSRLTANGRVVRGRLLRFRLPSLHVVAPR